MNATLKYILIKTNSVKPNYIVLHDDMLKTVVKVDDVNATLITMNDPTLEVEVPIKDIIKNVVKFLAIVNNTTISIIHGSFPVIMEYFKENEELFRIFIEKKGSIEVNGRIKHILAYPQVDNIVELIDMKVAESKNVIVDKVDRVGVITKVESNKSTIRFRTFTADLKRAQFNIVGNNSREVFELC